MREIKYFYGSQAKVGSISDGESMVSLKCDGTEYLDFKLEDVYNRISA